MRRPVPTVSESLLQWLLDADPAVRWQVKQDLLGAPPDEVAAERARVATEGLGARLLALQAADGRWGGAAWNRGWNSTMHALTLLRELGLDPASESARRAVDRVHTRVTWKDSGPRECANSPFFAGELEPCINGQVAAAGAYFRQDVSGIIDRLLAEQLPDGGWNCEAAHGSTRSSFNTTICVLEALLEHERFAGARAAVLGPETRPQLGAPAFGAGRAVAKRRRERRAELRRLQPGRIQAREHPFKARFGAPGENRGTPFYLRGYLSQKGYG